MPPQTPQQDMTFSERLCDLYYANQRLIETVEDLHVKLMGPSPQTGEASSDSGSNMSTGLIPNTMQQAQVMINKNHTAAEQVEELIRNM